MKKLLLALALSAALVACKKKADTSAFSKSVQTDLEAMGYKGVKVSCPGDVEMKEGVKFTCTVKFDGKDYKFENTIGEVKDNQGSIAEQKWVGDEPPMPGAEEPAKEE